MKIIIEHFINLMENKKQPTETEFTRIMETEKILKMDAVL